MRLGIFGGTFDPVHIGHLVAAQVALEQAGLDKVLFVPAGVNPLKVGKTISAGAHRLRMVELAVESSPQFAVSDWELHRPGPSFTVDTLEHFHSVHPEAELFFIIGADNLHILPKWRAVDRIMELATVLAVTRPGFDLKTSACTALALYPEVAKRVQYVEIPGLNISSTWIRERLVKNLSVEHLVPQKVIGYSEENKLYERIPD
ncbi:nicotinate-nucleotide adenylyltransferase [Tumebacillus avium]|uniref:nicotinate-nucleotide adenylyltransferase n=1 Tax=Tumebacillus avium TaxID=1903704 RepID=UPI0012FDDD5B|nr:nicotinate-nucleotide adenylyltransferase [Tumebacillus avium]